MPAWLAAALLATCLYGQCVCSDFTAFNRTESGDNKACPVSPLWMSEAVSEIGTAVRCSNDPECHAFQYNTETGHATGHRFNVELSGECTEKPGNVYYGTDDGECLPGYTWNATARICYILPRQHCETWTKAQEICEKEGASLIVLKDETFKNFFLEQLRGISNIQGLCGHYAFGMWVGGTDTGSEDSFRWLDGSSFDRSSFAPNEPNGGTSENCVDLAFIHDFKANDNACTSKQAFACGKKM